MGGGKGGGGGGTSTVTQNADPWSKAQPFLEDIMGSAQNLKNSGTLGGHYPDFSTVVPLSSDTQAGMDAIRQRATAGSPLLQGAQQNALDTVSGKYLDPSSNPWLQSTFNDASKAVNSAVNGQFESAGRYGSGAHAGVLADKNNQLADAIYGGNYNNERVRQATMAALSPTLASTDYTDANALLQTGNIQQQQGANQLQDTINRFMSGDNRSYNDLARYQSIVGGYGGLGGSQTTNSPLYTNTASGVLGGGLSGLGLGSSLFSAFPETLGSIGLSSGGTSGILGGIGSLMGLFSDRRLKRNIRRVARLANGLPVYIFKYLWSDKDHVGVIADEVKKVIPKAVKRDASGFDLVDYAMLGV